MDYRAAIESINIAESLKEDKLTEIGNECSTGFEADLKSRSAWEDKLEEWTKLALQVREQKNYPWPNASNVKYPLLSTAAMQFAARAYPSLVPSDGRVVKCKAFGSDPEGKKAARSERLSSFMSYQIIEEMEDWEEEMDRLLMILPIIGCVFKKTYFDPIKEKPSSTLVYPKDFVINYWTKSIETSTRYTQIYRMTKNQVQERKNAKLYLDLDLGDPTIDSISSDTSTDPNEMSPSEEDETTPYIILEQHRWLDLDGDGYAEPYVVTFEKNTKKVLRIVARFTAESVKTDEKGKISRIEPIQYYTKYGFVPNPEGGFYDIGFGLLLGSINESVNTIVNQLVDAGTLSNLQSGFLAKGLRIKLGESRFQPGEWKFVNATGDDLKKSIFPLPVREPSNVLFQLLELLISSGKELASVAEIFVGKMPGQNTPATTTQSSIEQGMKLFTAIFKRVFRSLTKEFRKLYLLDRTHYDRQRYVELLDNQEAAQDFDGDEKDIIPAADPQATTDQEKQNKAQMLMGALQMGTINPQEATKRFLEANSIPDIGPLMQVPPPPPDPKAQEMQMKMQMEQQKHQMDMQAKQLEMQMEQQRAQLEMQLEQEKLKLEQMKLQVEKEKFQMEVQQARIEMQLEIQKAQIEAQAAKQQTMQQVHLNEMTHAQKMVQNQQTHEQQMSMAKEKPENKEKVT